MITLYVASAISGPDLPVRGLMYLCRSSTTAVNSFFVFLCRFDTSMRAASRP